MKRSLWALGLLLAVSSVCSAQQFTYYYPQVTAGTYDGGYWQTTIFLTNATTAPANGSITFTRDDASPYSLTWVNEAGQTVANGSVIGFQLNAGESRKFMTVADAALSTGFATVTANAPVLGTAMFTNFNSDGLMIGEAAVPAAIPLPKQAIFVDTENGFNTGIAIANPNNGQLNITFELVNTAGQLVATAKRQVPPNAHTAFFVSELFPGIPGMVGRVQFWCVNPMTSIGLRFGPTALFTTLAPVAVQ